MKGNDFYLETPEKPNKCNQKRYHKNIAGEGENAYNQHIFVILKCFFKSCGLQEELLCVGIMGIMRLRGNSLCVVNHKSCLYAYCKFIAN